MEPGEIDIRIQGEAQTPETIEVKDLCDLLTDLRKAIYIAGAIPLEDRPAVPLMSLFDIHPGSCTLRLKLTGAAQEAAATIRRAVADGDYFCIPVSSHEALYEASKLAIRRGWSLSLENGHESGSATISRERPVPDPKALTVRGTTTIYGICMRVGGRTPSAQLRLLKDNSLLTISVDDRMARRLALRLYQEVGLAGDAAWRMRDWELVSFRATKLLDYEHTGLSAAFAGLAEAAKGRWDGVDVEAYVRDLREEGEDEDGWEEEL